MKVVQTKEELKEKLKEQLDLMAILADSYDNGNTIVAKSIATAVRVLMHDTSLSHSLIGQLELKDEKFFDTSFSAESIPNVKDLTRVGSFCGLVGMSVCASAKAFIPYLDEVPKEICGYVGFDDYWNRIIFIDQYNNSFSRKELILAVANQDGGAHVSPDIDKKYRQLARENSLGWKVSTDGRIWKNPEGAELAAVRQIGHELLRTLKQGYPNKKMIVSGNGVVMGGMGVWLGKPDKNIVKKVGRNEKCPCGSNLKYKKCHGKNL